MKKLFTILTTTCLVFGSFLAQATVKPNSLFSNNMVLQRGVIVPVWGTAKEGETVTVEFAGQKQTVVAAGGKWIVKLKALKEGGPFEMTIKGENTVVIKNILIGEVWLCSGQSNMGFPLRAVRAIGNYPKVAEVLRDAQNYPLIRQFSIPLIKNTAVPAMVDDVNGKWKLCDSISARDFSAVGYFFARELYKELKMPIGIINSSYGGTACENWMSKETLESFPELTSIFTNYEKAIGEFPKKLEEFKKNEKYLLEGFKRDSADAKNYNREIPRKPSVPMSPAERGGPTGLYNTMIAPLMPYAIKGAVWYQGEANGSRGLQYRTLLPALIKNWRSQWGIGDFPFLIVQIPGWKNHFPELREAQLMTWQKVPNTSMTVINDCDESVDVHPGNKQPVGERLSLAARAIAYKEKIEFSGPVYESMKMEGNTIVLTFTHVGKGLVAKNGELTDFSIAGSDKKFVPAKAIIKGKTISISADGITNPVAVRLGWNLTPKINLYNQEGLPATPFRTDVE